MYTKGNRPSGKGRFTILDSEAIGFVRQQRKLDPSSMHCIVVKDDRTQEVFRFFDPYEKRDPETREELLAEGTQDGYLWDGIKFIAESACIISQNFSGYDALSFEKVFGKEFHVNYMERRGKKADRSWYYPNKVMDTYTMSCVLNPERRVPPQAYALGRGNVGPHSIEAHGIRIGRYKPDNEDWSRLTDHMLHRCAEDVHIGQDMYHYLMKEWEEQGARVNPRTRLGINTAYRCELQTAFAIARQAQRGFRIDVKLAVDRCLEIDKETIATEDGFRPHMPLRLCKAKLAVPINGHTHGSKYNTQIGITKKVTPKAWCTYSQSGAYELEYDAEMLLGLGEKITQKEWLQHCPSEQLNSIGEYTSEVTKRYPECRGFITDHDNPIVVGPFTPIEYEEIPLGNRNTIKQILHEHGWLGVIYNDAEQSEIDAGRENELNPWAGKIEEKSIEAWRERDGSIPSWCEGIARWYILRSRRQQILNSDDVEYFDENGMWPKHRGKRKCRGILPQSFNVEYGMTAMDYYAEYKRWPTDVTEEWRAPAEAFPCATNTFRMRHKVVVNIPSRGLYPLRDLFIAGIGKMILGCDGAGLELRMLAHFLADAIYQDVVLSGDIHTYNQTLAGLPKRDMAKTFIYAFLYGSGAANLAKVCGMSVEEMARKIDTFKRQLPALADLIDRITLQGEKYGYLLSVDGRWGRIRMKEGKLLVHTMLNVLLQMTGSICMKYGLCFAERTMIDEGVGLDADGFVAWVANVHDEMQMEVDENEVEYIEYTVTDWKAEEKREHLDDKGRMWSAPRIVSKSEDEFIVKRYYHRAGEIICNSLTKAGEFLKMRCPLAGEYMIGNSWHDTH